MSGDRLDQIEANARKSGALLAWLPANGPNRPWRDDVLSLVAVARAARDLMENMAPADANHTWPGENELRTALGRLERDPAVPSREPEGEA